MNETTVGRRSRSVWRASPEVIEAIRASLRERLAAIDDAVRAGALDEGAARARRLAVLAETSARLRRASGVAGAAPDGPGRDGS